MQNIFLAIVPNLGTRRGGTRHTSHHHTFHQRFIKVYADARNSYTREWGLKSKPSDVPDARTDTVNTLNGAVTHTSYGVLAIVQ